MNTPKAWRIDTPSSDELHSLIEQPLGSCISLFLPIQAAEPMRQHPIRLEYLLAQAEARLLARGLSLAAMQALLAPAWQLVEDWAFWEHRNDGLAIFAAPTLFRVYKLPLAFKELLVIDERPHVTPLLPLFSGDGQFYVLALNLQRVRLLQGSHYSLRPLALPGVPTSLKDALK